MASDLSSGSTEVNELFDDEKEEGEISLEDVSSSEEGQPYKYRPRAFGQCPYCLSTKECATWCRSLTINRHVPRDAGLQGKENRGNQRYPPTKDRTPEPQPITKSSAPYSTLQEKNDVDEDLVPISSDSDMELVGLGHDVASVTAMATAKKLERQKSRRASLKKPRKRRRKKSSSELSLSLSPSSVDLALKESIHRVEPTTLKKDSVSHSKGRHHSPDRKKMSLSKSPPAKRHRSPVLRVHTSPTLKRRTRSSALRKSSPMRLRKQGPKRVSPTSSLDIPVMTNLLVPTSRGTVSKLLKKVKKLDPFSMKSNERTSLKDKLSNIMKNKVTETPPANSEEVVGNKEEKQNKAIAKDETPIIPKDKEEEGTKETEKEKEREEDKEDEKEKVDKKEKAKEEIEKKEEKKKVEEKEKEVPVQEKTEDNEDDEDLVVLREIALQTKQKKFVMLRPEEIKTEPVEAPPAPVEPPPPPQQPQHKLPNFCMDDNDEDLELRMIALRSAVLKKHRTRMQCGGLKKKQQQQQQRLQQQQQQQLKDKTEETVPRIESPFTSTFNEDFPLLAEICSPTSPLSFKKDTYGTEDMELDSDMELDTVISEPEVNSGNESPYSPTDDLNATAMNATVINTPQQQHTVNLSLYSPSKPTETPVFKSFPTQQENRPKENNDLDGSILEFVTQESRPYSPTDATIYDPDLPGVLSAKTSGLQQQQNQPVPPPLLPPPPPPLEPPPMPPMSIFTQQPMMITCPTNLMNPFCDTTMTPPMAPMNNFTALHQSMNPLMMPAATPLFAYPAPPTSATTMCMSSSSMAVPPPQPQTEPQPPPPPPPIENDNITNELDDFGETDLDGSPLVPIDKDSNNQVSSWPLIGEPLYLQGVPEITQSELSKVPTLMEHNLVPATVLKTNPQLQKQPVKRLPPQQHEQNSECLFRNADMRPVPLETGGIRMNCSSSNIPIFKPIRLQPALKKIAITKSAPAFNASINEEGSSIIEQQTTEEQKEEVPTVMKSPKESKHRRRRRRRSTLTNRNLKEIEKRRTPRREIDNDRVLEEESSKLSNNLDTQTQESREIVDEAQKKLPKPDEKRRRASIDDDEDTLRKLLLASLEKRKKEQPEGNKTQVVATPSTDATPTEMDEDSSKVASPVIPTSEKSVLTSTAKLESTPKVTPSQIPKCMAIVTTTRVTATTTTTNPLKRTTPASTSSSLNEQVPRKVLKKTNMIPASTKVVNNAKRYQNLLLQRKLAQQKGQLAATKSRFKVNNNGLQRSASPNVPAKLTTEFQRIVINLNEDTESESDVDDARAKVSPVKSRPPLAIPTTDFEKSVDQFLKNVRQQQEQQMTKNTPVVSRSESPKSKPIAAVKKVILPPPVTTVTKTATTVTKTATNVTKTVTNVTTTKTTPSLATTKTTVTKTTGAASSATTNTTSTSSTTVVSLAKEKIVTSKPTLIKIRSKLDSLSNTPQAVKHLPASQQEEYRRLKLQILQREKLKLQKSKELAAISATPQASCEKSVDSSVTVTPVLTSSTPKAASTLSAAKTSTVKLITATTASTTKTSQILTSPIAKPASAASSPLATASGIITSPLVKPSTSIASSSISSAITTSPLGRPKTQLVATIIPMSKIKEKSILPSTTPVTTSKIIHSTANAKQDSTLSQTVSTSLSNKLNVMAKPSTSGAMRITPKTSAFNRQAAILSKITETINNQKKQVIAVADKVSNLRVLTTDQINLKNAHSQELKPRVENRMLASDLDKSGENRKPNILKTEKSINSSTASDITSDISTSNMSTSLNLSYSSIESSSSMIGKNRKSWEDYKQDINNEVHALSQLSFEEQKKILCKSEEELVKKRHVVLDDISEMSGNLREWEFERDVQKRLSDQIKKLREELRLAEEQLQQQKEKMSTIQPRISLYHEKINSGRKECFRLSKICNGLGQQIQGSNYEVPTAAADLLNTKIKEIAIHSQKLRNKKPQTKETTRSNNSIKTDKPGNKNNSKVLVNSKNKKTIIKEKNVNGETEISVSESDSNSVAENIDILENNSFTEINTTNSNSENMNNESNQMEISVENSSVTYENNSIELKPFSGTVGTTLNLNSVNDLNNEIINNNTNEIVDTKNILKSEMEEQSIITKIKDEISSENVNENEPEISPTQVTDSETLISSEAITTVLIAPLTNREQLNESGQISKKINSEDTNQITDSITERSISNNIVNDNLLDVNSLNFTDNQQTSFEVSDQLINQNLLTNAPAENLMVVQANIEVQQEEIIENNSEQASDNNFTESNSISKDNICIESMSAESGSQMNQNNTNLPVDNIINSELNNSPMEIDAENEKSNKENVEIEVNVMANEPRITNTIMETENVEDNKQDKRREKLNVNCAAENTVENSELNSSEICADTGHSTLMEEIALLEMANETEVPEIITYKAKSAEKIEEPEQLIQKQDPSIKEQEISRKGTVQPYESILKHLQAPRNNKIDGILCPYELMGTCNDGDCQFIHQSTSHSQ